MDKKFPWRISPSKRISLSPFPKLIQTHVKILISKETSQKGKAFLVSSQQLQDSNASDKS